MGFIGARTNHDPSAKRIAFDFYSTPPIAVQVLLKQEEFDGEIWECASGDGQISKYLEKRGYSVKSTDLRETADIYGEKGIDFLECTNSYDNIVTNPPYKYGEDFVHKALELSKSGPSV